MPFASPHVYLTFGGAAWSAQEEWQTGLRFPTGSALTSTALEGFLDDAIGPITTWFSAPGLLFSSAIQLGWIKAADIGEDGRYFQTSFNPQLHEVVPPVAGTGNTSVLPQSSVVVSLETGFNFGRARSGRCYLPPMPTAVPSTASGTMSASSADAVRSAFVDLLQALNAAAAAQGTGVIGEASVMSSIGTGVTRPITSVKVGRVVDTQRRRRGGIPENYSTSEPV